MKPRYEVKVSVPRYDNRDAICGSTVYTIATAETLGWAEHLASVEQQKTDPDYMSEISIYVVDTVNSRRAVREVADTELPF